MKRDNIISDKLSSIMPLFLQVDYLKTTTLFNKPLIFTKISEHYIIPTQFLFLTISPSTNTISVSIENINTSTEATTIDNLP